MVKGSVWKDWVDCGAMWKDCLIEAVAVFRPRDIPDLLFLDEFVVTL